MNLKDEKRAEENIDKLLNNKDLETEFMMAARTLIETKEYHEQGHYDQIWPRVGRSAVIISKDKYDIRESLSGVLKEDEMLKPVKFYGSINSISAPYPHRMKSDAGSISNFNAIDLDLIDKNKNLIKTIPIVTDNKKKKITDLSKRYSLFCFYGLATYGLKKKNKTKKINLNDLEYKFILNDLEPAENLIEINNYTEAEIKNARNLIKKLGVKNNGTLEYIYSKVSTGLGIKGLNNLPLLKVSLEFLVLQSLSDYTISNRSAKLHSLIVGPPATGKGKLVEAVQVINPVFGEASIAKSTPAGLIGSTKSVGGKWQSEPGMIPMAHRGVLAIQDFHDVKNKHEIFNIFSKVMEDGVVIDSSASNTKHGALTSIHIDTNKLADVYYDESTKISKSRFKELKKIGIPLQILSRFDFIADIKRDLKQAKKTGRDILSPDSDSQLLISDLVLEPWARELQAIVAILRMDLPKITILPTIADYMQEKYDELTGKIDADNEYISDFLPRLSQSFKKITIATCRANSRKEPTKDDVDYAFRFVELKLEFLLKVKPEGLGEHAQTSDVNSVEHLISKKFEGEIISLPTAIEHANSQMENPLGDRQIRRHLDDNFKKAGLGKWKIDKLTS